MNSIPASASASTSKDPACVKAEFIKGSCLRQGSVFDVDQRRCQYCEPGLSFALL